MADLLLSSFLSAGGASTVFGASLTGTLNGINDTFSAPAAFALLSTALYVNGLRLTRGVDYSETSGMSVTFSEPPLATDELLLDYLPA